MSASSINNTVKILLQRYGRTFAEDLGLHPEQNQPSPLYCLLISSALFSTRISHIIALKSARILFDHGWTTPERMAASTWEQRVRALDEGGYVRYDERTATMLGQTAQMLIDSYHGDLRSLRDAAHADPVRERELLDQFPGIGEVAVNIFFREVQLAWPELFPFADERTLASAAKLGLPADAAKLAALVRNRRDYVRLVSALIRVQLERKHDEVLAAARAARERYTSARS
jgi:endonuclease III